MNIVLNFTPHLHKLHNCIYMCSTPHLLHKLPSPQQCSQTVSTYYTQCYTFQLAFCHAIRHASMWFCSTIEHQRFELPSERVPPLICTSCITVRVPPLVCTGLRSSAQSCITNEYCTDFIPHLLKWILHPESLPQFAWHCTNKCSSSTWLCNIF